MKKFMKIFGIIAAAAVIISCFAACGSKTTNGAASAPTGTIDVVSRESGSGTRGAFTELLGIVDANGNDATVNTAEVTNSTAVMMQTVAGDKQAIGYVSLGSLGTDVKALKLDGVEASVDNINNGTYKLARPFNIVYKDGSLSETAQDFVKYILSVEGQKIINDEGYIEVGNGDSYSGGNVTGTISISGSTSVGPVMEALADAYKAVNPGVTINIEQNGSTAGVQAAQQGVVDFGMASRELTDEEKTTVTSAEIAKDGIAVIVNKANSTDSITADQAKNIFLGSLTSWDDLAV